MPPLIGDLDVRDQQIELLACLGLSEDLLIKDLAAALMQKANDPLAMTEVIPKLPGVEELELLLLIAEQLPQPPVVKQKATVFIDDIEPGGAVIQDFAKLTLLLSNLRLMLDQRRDA